MNIKIFMAAAVAALTVACTPAEEAPSVSEAPSAAEAAGPEAEAAFHAAEGAEVIPDSEAAPQAVSK